MTGKETMADYSHRMEDASIQYQVLRKRPKFDSVSACSDLNGSSPRARGANAHHGVILADYGPLKFSDFRHLVDPV